MEFALITAGLIMIVTGAKNTYQQFGAQITSDFTGQNNFFYWLVALGAVGALGYVKPLKPFSHAFLALIVVAMVLKNGDPKAQNGGLFQQIQNFLKNGATAPATPPAGATSAANVATPSTSSEVTQAAISALPALL